MTEPNEIAAPELHDTIQQELKNTPDCLHIIAKRIKVNTKTLRKAAIELLGPELFNERELKAKEHLLDEVAGMSGRGMTIADACRELDIPKHFYYKVLNQIRKARSNAAGGSDGVELVSMEELEQRLAKMTAAPAQRLMAGSRSAADIGAVRRSAGSSPITIRLCGIEVIYFSEQSPERSVSEVISTLMDKEALA